MDLTAIFYLLVLSRSLDPVIEGVANRLIEDGDMVLLFMHSSSAISIIVSIVLFFTLDYLEKKLLMLAGVLVGTLGILMVGPCAYLIYGGKIWLRIGLLFLGVAECVGTGTGFGALYYTVVYVLRLEIDENIVQHLTVFYVFFIHFSKLVGPVLMFWVELLINYVAATCILAGCGVLLSLVYLKHYRDYIMIQYEDNESTGLLKNKK